MFGVLCPPRSDIIVVCKQEEEMSKQKKVCIFVVVAAIVCIGIFVRYLGDISSHHASIHVDLSTYNSRENRLAEYERIMSTINQWASELDMYLVESDDDPVSLSSVNSNPNSDERVTYYKDKLPSGKSMSLEAMITYDANGSLQKVRIMFAEGYSRKPSQRLQQLYEDLQLRLRNDYGDKVTFSIW